MLYRYGRQRQPHASFASHQDGLTLPNRDYYLETDDKMAAIRARYQTYYDTIHRHLGHHMKPDYNVWMHRTCPYKASWTDSDLRDIHRA